MSNKEKLLASAQKNLEKGQFAKAVKDYEGVVALEPKDRGHRQKLADALVRAQMPAAALPHYEFVATSLSDAGFYLKAIAIYKQMQKIEPDRFDIFLRLAQLNEKQGLAGNASAEYQNLAALYIKKGMITEAVTTLQKVADMEPGNILHKVRIAECYARSGFKDKGREEFEHLAAELEAQKRFDQLLKVYELYVKTFPNALSAQAGFARTLVLRGDAEKGMQLLKNLIKQSPDDVDILNALASGYQALGDFENEYLALQHLLKKRPDDLNDRERLIRSFLAAGDFERGLDELLKWGEKLRQSGRTDAVHAFCRHLQQELSGDNDKLLQLLSSLGKAPASTTPPVAPAISASDAGDFDLGLELGGLSIFAPPVPASEDNGAPLQGSANVVDVLDASAALLPSEVSLAESGSGSALSPAPVLGAEETPLDFLEGFGVFSGAVDPPPVLQTPTPPAPVPATSGMELEIDLELGPLETADGAALELDATVDLPAPGAIELADDALDASTEIAFPDDFSLDLSSSDLAAVTPDVEGPPEVSVGDNAYFFDTPSIELSMPEEGLPDFASGLELEIAGDDAAAEVVEPLAELEQLEELEDLEELEELEDLEEITEEDVSLTLANAEREEEFATALDLPDTSIPVTEIDIPDFSLDGLPEVELETPVMAVSPDVETDDSERLEMDLSPVQDLGYELDPSAPTLVLESFSPVVEDEAVGGVEEIAEFDLSALSVDDTAPAPDPLPEVAAVAQVAAPSFDELTAELEEVGFYLNQGLYTEAEQICRRLLEIDPGFAPALDKLAEVESRRHTVAPAAEPAMGDFLDLAAEILDDGALRATENLSGVDDLDRFRFDGVFSEFKKGIEAQIDHDDTESHYNLGIAYKEMGLLDDALSEFAKAMANPARRLDCLTLQGICLAEKGAFAQAEELFASGINNRDLSEMERVSLHYEMGLLYESWQRPADALSSFSTVAASDTVFRDVTSKIRELKNRLGDAGEQPSAEITPAKNRVSYV